MTDPDLIPKRTLRIARGENAAERTTLLIDNRIEESLRRELLAANAERQDTLYDLGWQLWGDDQPKPQGSPSAEARRPTQLRTRRG